MITEQIPIINPPTFTRSSVAYLSNGTQVAANQPRFEQGKFGKAIIVEEGTTNLVNVASWNPVKDDSYETIIQTSEMIMGYPVYQATKKNTSTPPTTIYRLSIPNGATFTASIYVNQLQVPVLEAARLIFYRADLGTLAAVYAPKVTGWQRISVTYTNNTGMDLTNVYVYFYPSRNTGEVTLFGAPQLEQKPYATSFIDGTRSRETLTIPTAGVLNPQEGTVEFWVKPLVVANWNNFFYMATSNGRFLLYFTTDGRAAFDYGASNSGPAAPAGTIEANNWYYIALRWSAITGKQALFINGVKYEKDLPNGVATSFPSTVSVVNNYSAYIDDLRISSRARTDEEILAAYQSNAPLVVDKWTTYKLNFDDNLNFEQGAYTSSTLENIYTEYDIINSTTKKYIYKIEWLTPQEEVIGDVIGDIISGSANFDATNNNRRSVSLTLRNLDKQYIPSPTSKMWINNKFRLLCGYEYNGEQILYNQGIYVLGNPSLLSTPKQKEVTIEGLDKWVLLDGTIAGTLANKYIINVDTRIDEAVKSIIIDLIGETKYIIDECSVLTPYTIEKPAGSTIADMLLELANMVSYSVYYNEEGYLCFKNPLKPEDYAITPPVWQYTTSGLYLQSTRELNWNDIKNSIIVYGMTENGYQYTATAKDLTGSELSIDKIGERVKVIEDDNIYSDDLCQQRANYELQQSIMAQETVNITSIPNFKLKLDDVVNVEDENNGTTGNYVIRNISYDLSYRSTMNIGVWAIRHIG